MAWGANYSGQAGPRLADNVVAVAAGEAHSLALRSDGTVLAWGSNFGYVGNTGQAVRPA
jgi:alpha-tubulin suppressor-like RCC1 family protein